MQVDKVDSNLKWLRTLIRSVDNINRASEMWPNGGCYFARFTCWPCRYRLNSRRQNFHLKPIQNPFTSSDCLTMSLKAVSSWNLMRVYLDHWKLDGACTDRKMYFILKVLASALNELIQLLAVLSGDTLVLRGRPGPQGQPPKERYVHDRPRRDMHLTCDWS